MPDIVLASRNAKKLKELHSLIAPLGFTPRLVSEFSDEEVAETAPTFIENALLKARHASRVSGLPAMADDSGLEVAALHGAPGVYSARYGETDSFASTARMSVERRTMDGRAVVGTEYRGRAMDGMTQAERDAANNAKLLLALRDVPAAQRGARFVCALVWLRHADDPLPLLAVGTWAGRILDAPRGSKGFGYDPLFWVDSHQCSSAELASEEKNRISHRAQALRLLLAQLEAGAAL